MRPAHDGKGNCWERAYCCPKCSAESDLCDVCHEHDQPRGECLDCPRCPACDLEDSEQDCVTEMGG